MRLRGRDAFPGQIGRRLISRFVRRKFVKGKKRHTFRQHIGAGHYAVKFPVDTKDLYYFNPEVGLRFYIRSKREYSNELLNNLLQRLKDEMTDDEFQEELSYFLHECADYGRLDIMKILVEEWKAKFNIDPHLAGAFKSGNVEMVEYLESLGQTFEDDFWEMDAYLYALSNSVETGNLKMTKFLILRNTDEDGVINERFINFLNDAFIHAARLGRLEIMDYLFSLEIITHLTVLRSLKEFPDLETLDYLISHGGDVNYDDGMPLIDAVQNNRLKVAELLILRGADVDIIDTEELDYIEQNETVRYIKSLQS
jgi:hypothetical protein